MQVTISGTYNRCQWSGGGTISLSSATGSQGTLDLAPPDDNYFLAGHSNGTVMLTLQCPDQAPVQIPEPAGMELVRSHPGSGRSLPGPGGVLSGSASLEEPMMRTEWTWSLHPHA